MTSKIKQRRHHNHIHQIGHCWCGLEVCLKCGPCPKCSKKSAELPKASVTVHDIIVLETAAKTVLKRIVETKGCPASVKQLRTAIRHVNAVLVKGGYRE